MDYSRSTFYDKYTPLTDKQILQKLTPLPRPASASPTSAMLAGTTLKIVLDEGPTLEYSFSEETLTFKEDGGTAAQAPYTALALEEFVLFSHIIPGTVRGYNIIADRKTNLVTAFEVWFCGFDKDKREVWRSYMFGYVDISAPEPSGRHGITNRLEGGGLYWRDDDGREMLCFFPSVIWSSFIELSHPRGGITMTAPSDYIKVSDRYYIYSRVEVEYSGMFTLELLDLYTVRHIGVRLGFNHDDALEYEVYSGSGRVTGRYANLEPLTDYGTVIPLEESRRKQLSEKGARPTYRPRFLHHDFTKEQVDEIIRKNTKLFEGRSIMTSYNTMEVSDYMAGKRFTLRFDDGPAWEYDIADVTRLKWRAAGDTDWHEELYQAFEPAKDIIIFCHICTGSNPMRCLTHAVDFSNGLVTCVDAQVGNERKPWEVGHRAIFGVMEMDGGPTPPAVQRHGFTTDLVGRAYAWTYGETMQSIHVYSAPESYSWTIMLPNSTGGPMWSSPCFYVKLREDAYLMSWTEDTCNGNQGTFVFNPRIMHDAGFFFGIGDMGEEPDLHVHALGAYGRPLDGFNLTQYFQKKQ